MAARFRALLLIVVSALVPSAVTSAAEMSVRDILHLNQYEEGVRGISWCDDNNFILVRPAISDPAPRDKKDLDFAEMSVKKFSMVTKIARPLLQYHNAEVEAMSADCLRNGEYAFVHGSTILAGSTYASGRVRLPFAHLIDVTEGGRPDRDPRHFDFLSGSPAQLSTAPDGSIYGDAHIRAGIDLSGGTDPKTRLQVKDRATSHRTSGVITLTSYKTEPPAPFAIYGLQSSYYRVLGSYRCSAQRPGCRAGSAEQNAVYFAFVQYTDEHNAGKYRFESLFTVTPDKSPWLQRWPITAKPGASLDKLSIVQAAVDETRCHVLLLPNPELPENQVNGRLRLEFYVANCAFKGNKLELDEPRIVGRRRASFMVPHLSLHGDYLAIVETLNMSEQPEDQAEIEKNLVSQVGPCAHIYRSEATSMTAVNTICVSAQGNDITRFKISPGAKYIGMQGNKDSVIVGREYRNDGSGPKWISNGDRL